MEKVSVYSEVGWQRDLTSLNQGRRQHACGSYVNGGKKVNHIMLLCQCHTQTGRLGSTEFSNGNRNFLGKLCSSQMSSNIFPI